MLQLLLVVWLERKLWDVNRIFQLLVFSKMIDVSLGESSFR
jgi:hypothetical protein